MLRHFLIAIAFVGIIAATPVAATPASADGPGSLFVNLTTEESHRVDMALKFSGAMQERGHPLIIWMNDKGVLVAAKENAGKFGPQQKELADLMAKGATVIVCPMCMKHYGVKDGDLIDGAKVGNPDLTSGLLFKEDVKTLTW